MTETWSIRHTDGTEDTVEAVGLRIDAEDYIFFDDAGAFVWCAPRQFVVHAKKIIADTAAPTSTAPAAPAVVAS